MFTLTLRNASSIPLDLEGVTPQRVAGLSAAEVERLKVYHGNRHEPLAEFFTVTAGASVPGADLQLAGDTASVKGIGAGMSGGFVYVENAAGMHAGARMTGGRLVIDGSAGDWLGAEMIGGIVEVRGAAGNQAGAAYRGSRRGMTGGIILIRRGAGDELGLLMRRGLIVVMGACGEFAGASMIAGTIVLLDDMGERLGAGMKRGTIIAAREPRLPPTFRRACDFRPTFLPLLRPTFQKLDLEFPPGLGGLIRCHRGDLLAGGRGEVLSPAGP